MSQNSDSAFDILELNEEDGTATIKIKKGIMGPMANQLKSTSDKRKAATILRKLGFVIAEAGDRLYGQEVEEGELAEFVQ